MLSLRRRRDRAISPRRGIFLSRGPGHSACAIAILVLASCSPPPRIDESVTFARAIEHTAIPVFARVSPTLYRGGEPGEVGLHNLRDRGIKTVISLREIPPVQDFLDHYGMAAFHIPMAAERPPSSIEEKRFLDLVSDTSLHPVFVHCVRGKDRTGVMIALYRVRIQGWSTQDAIAEMKHFGYSSNAYPALEKYVRSLR